MDDFVRFTLSRGRGQVTLNRAAIASARSRVTGHGSFIVCFGGACYTTDTPFELPTEVLA